MTHLKAPWPAGTVPGHVVELAGVDAIPGWALGKCTPAADDAEAVSVWMPPVVPAELGAAPAEQPQTLVVNPAGADPAEEELAAKALADAEAQAQAERQALEARQAEEAAAEGQQAAAGVSEAAAAPASAATGRKARQQAAAGV